MTAKELNQYYHELKIRGLSPERDQLIRREIALAEAIEREAPESDADLNGRARRQLSPVNLYHFNDLIMLQALRTMRPPQTTGLQSVDELLDRDKQRESDGFPKKIRVGRLIKPGKGGKDNIVIVPTTIEEKFIHDTAAAAAGDGGMGGSGAGEEGDVIGEQPVRAPGIPGAGGAGEGEGGAHELESSAYDLGRILTEKFELPNLKDKGKRRSLTRYTYDMTDRNRGFGQILDKKATLRKIVQTNMSLGNIADVSDIDTTSFLIAPSDKIYRILSREKDYESQAMVFFLRDYSGSMSGKPTTLVVAQHVLIYSWLMYQYGMHVESRFIVHDTEAQEVEDFYTYYSAKVAGGTKVASAFNLVNDIIERESLVQDYNIYVFHGTDGDDWDTNGDETLPALKKTLEYANRVGITVARHAYAGSKETEVEKYLKQSGLLDQKPKHLRLDTVQEDADEPRLIEGIKHLISD